MYNGSIIQSFYIVTYPLSRQFLVRKFCLFIIYLGDAKL